MLDPNLDERPLSPLEGAQRGPWPGFKSAGMLLLGCGTILPSCGEGPPIVRGTGPVVREQHALRPVSEIGVKGHVDLTISVIQKPANALAEDSGQETMVFLEGAEDLLDWIEVELDGDALTIGVRDQARLDPLPTIHVDIASLSSLAALGSGDIELRGLSPRACPDGEFEASVAGSVDVTARGEVEILELNHAGSGDLDFQELHAVSATYSGAGSGDVRVHVSGSLESSSVGSGDVHVYGSVPDEAIQSSTAGTTKLKRVR